MVLKIIFVNLRLDDPTPERRKSGNDDIDYVLEENVLKKAACRWVNKSYQMESHGLVVIISYLLVPYGALDLTPL